MKNDIKKNIIIANGEEIIKEFPKLKGLGFFCQVILTTKRLIIYTQSTASNRNRKVKKRGMNEIELKSISHSEYYIEFIKNSFFVRFIGFVFFIGAFILAWGVYKNLLAFLPGLGTSTYNIIYYVFSGLLLILGLILMFKIRKILFFKIISGFNIETELELKPTTYNELSVKFIASKFY